MRYFLFTVFFVTALAGACNPVTVVPIDDEEEDAGDASSETSTPSNDASIETSSGNDAANDVDAADVVDGSDDAPTDASDDG